MPLDFSCQIVANMPYVHITHSTKMKLYRYFVPLSLKSIKNENDIKSNYKGALRTEATY